MNVFETIKAAVPMREAAEHYGLRVLPNGMACCPFHDDHHPSLKLNEDYFFCFGCNAHGDVIDFTAKLWGLSAQEAVEKLRGDFGIETGQMPIPYFPGRCSQSGTALYPCSQGVSSAAANLAATVRTCRTRL